MTIQPCHAIVRCYLLVQDHEVCHRDAEGVLLAETKANHHWRINPRKYVSAAPVHLERIGYEEHSNGKFTHGTANTSAVTLWAGDVLYATRQETRKVHIRKSQTSHTSTLSPLPLPCVLPVIVLKCSFGIATTGYYSMIVRESHNFFHALVIWKQRPFIGYLRQHSLWHHVCWYQCGMMQRSVFRDYCVVVFSA